MSKVSALIEGIRSQDLGEVNAASIIDSCINFGLVHDSRIDYGEWQSYMNTTREENGVYQTPQQIADAILELHKHDIKSYLEVGVFNGGSHLLISEYLKLKNPKILCAALDITDEYLSDEVRQYINFVKGTSDSIGNEFYDLVFIDAGHNYDEVKRDYYNVGVNAKIVMFHDINEATCPGVIRFWDEIKAGKKYKEYLYQTSGKPVHGIGLLFQDGEPEVPVIDFKSKALVVTRCTRQDNLKKIYASIQNAFKSATDQYEWVVLFDTFKIEGIKSSTIRFLDEAGVKWAASESKEDHYTDVLNEFLKTYSGDATHVYLMDDDNLMHPELASALGSGCDVIAFHQIRWDWVKIADPAQIQSCSCVNHMDAAQFLLSISKLREVGFYSGGYASDGLTLDSVLRSGCTWKIINKVLAYYNIIGEFTKSSKPKVGLVSDFMVPNNPIYEAINKSAFDTLVDMKAMNPDAIIVAESLSDHESLVSSITKGMLSKERVPISIFTSAYNIGSDILRTWESILAQDYDNWEWVVVNDSEDGGVTEGVLRGLAASDSRIKLYSFSDKTRGRIGEAKYRAGMLCSGSILVELDHDDELLPDALTLIKRAFDENLDCGFAYSDAVELDNDNNTPMYASGFAMGYGKYYKSGKWDVSDTPDINPLTIRHIVGVPNHVRAWRRDVYNSLGGHNRELRIADDYELIVRTFLITKFVKIPKLLYIQHLGGGTSQDSFENRADIQRKVKAIYEFYNSAIKDRFESLGIEDWGYVNTQEELFKIKPRQGSSVNKLLSL